MAWNGNGKVQLALLAALASLGLERLARWRLAEAAQVAAELARDGYQRSPSAIAHGPVAAPSMLQTSCRNKGAPQRSG